MEGLIITLLLALFAAIFIFPIIIIVKINSLKDEMSYLRALINGLLTPENKPSTAENVAVSQDIAVPEEPEMPETMEIKETKEEAIEAADTYEAMVIREEPDVHNISIDDSNIVPPIPTVNNIDERNIFEKLLGTNWLSKIGIVTLVLGIGFFVKYAIDKDWINETARVGIGLLTGGIIIAIAHRLRTKYYVFSSILVGGGIAVFYITITLAFRQYELFSQTLAFVLLILITVFSVILSLLYNRKELAVFSLLGGFASPLMVSTGIGNYMVLFSYIFILNTGMLIISYIKKWRVIGIISFVLTLVFFWVWILNSYNNQFFNVSLFITLFFLQFYLLALFDHYKSGKKQSAYQVFLILTNNFSTFLAYLYVFNHYSYDLRGLITISLAVVNAVVLVIVFRNSRIDRNIVYLIIAIVLSFVSLAIPVQLKGHVITLFWAAESVILLWLWQKSRIKVFYAGFILISLLVIISYFMDVSNLYSLNHTMTIIANRLFITGIVVVAAFVVNALLLKREPMATKFGKQSYRIFNLIIVALAYIIPFIELDMQLAHYTNLGFYETSSFRFVALATFTTIYVAVLGFVYNKNVAPKKYIFGLLYLAVFLYATYYMLLVTNLRYDIFYSIGRKCPVSYFSIHLLSLPAIAYIIYLVAKNIKSLTAKQDVWLSWLLTVLVVVISSVETDNVVVWISGNYNNYYGILHDIHTFGYPILWGIIAMILMIWGLNGKEALLRKISLVFFGLIIVKFYAYDVWTMSQYGRIISFVLLGVILLLVSFLQEKIRILVKNDNETENEKE